MDVVYNIGSIPKHGCSICNIGSCSNMNVVYNIGSRSNMDVV